MSEAAQELDQKREILGNLIADREALMSPAWQRIREMIVLRREILRSQIEDCDDDGAPIIRTKGRVQECKTMMNMLPVVEESIKETLGQVEELEDFCKEEEAAIAAEEQGEY